MSVLHTHYTVEIENTQLVLLPSKLVWWPDQQILFMADSHFGKASAFRKAGLAVPTGTTAAMLRLLSTEISVMSPERLVVLGDLLHSRISSNDDFENELKEWRKIHRDLKVQLVRGNHDTKGMEFYERLAIEVFPTQSIEVGPFELCHDPTQSTKRKFALCGHIHPAIQLAGHTLKCFWLRHQDLVLPAFGEFTGSAKVSLSANDTAIAICDDHLIAVPN